MKISKSVSPSNKTAKAPVVVIGGVKVRILSHPGKGTISRVRLKKAVAAMMETHQMNSMPLAKGA
ncbi:MAG: hypothetical protein ACKVY0_04380 [Prosthecobacter sp.]|uniref:hypothetical protein n=1 Tax=Prosthecobacter sp. TaxID=1965333 RepID=UPI003903BC66